MYGQRKKKFFFFGQFKGMRNEYFIKLQKFILEYVPRTEFYREFESGVKMLLSGRDCELYLATREWYV